MPIFLYGRVSHKSSEISGLSMEDQIEAEMKYTSLNIPHDTLSTDNFASDTPGLFLDKSVSGWSKQFAQRPAGRVIMDQLQAGDHVIFYSIDRFARNLRDFANTTFEIDQRGAYLHYVYDRINTSTAIGKLQAHMRAAMAQFASDIISERTREALAIKRMLAGQTPFERIEKKRKWLSSEFAPQSIIKPPLGRPTGRIFRYERVSSNEQYTSGLGLQVQSQTTLRAAESLAQEIGSVVYPHIFTDPAVSAFRKKFNERKAGAELLDVVRPGDDIVVYRLDRAWRNPIDALEMCEELRKRDVYVHLINEGIRTDTRQGVEWIGLLASMAHMESTLKSQRTREAKARCKAEGRPAGYMARGFKAKDVGATHRKMVLDIKDASFLAAVWVMKHEMKLTSSMIDDVLAAWHARKVDQKLSLKHQVRYNVDRKLRQFEEVVNRTTPSLKESLLERGRELVSQPIEHKFWWRMKWEWPANVSHSDDDGSHQLLHA